MVRAPLMMLIISWSAMLATWPLLAFNFREVALPGIIVTVLALPAMPFIMAGTLAAAAVGLVSTTLGQFIGWMVWAPTSYLIELVKIAPKWTLQTDWAGNWLVAVWWPWAHLCCCSSQADWGGYGLGSKIKREN